MSSYLSRRGFLARSGAVGAAIATIPGFLSAPIPVDAARSAQSDTPAPKRGGTLSIGIRELLEDVSPRAKISLYDYKQMVGYTMYEPPVKYGAGGKVLPVLAESWDTSDPKRTVLTIRKGVEFHNGKTMTVDDMVDSIKSLQALGVALSPDVFESVKKIDSSRLVVTTKIPYRTLDQMRFWFITPVNTPSSAYETRSVGTGPFKLKRFVKGSHIDVVRNDRYWDSPKPYLDGLSFVFLTQTSVLVANFRSGTVNYLHDVPLNVLPQVANHAGSKLLRAGYFFHWWQPQMLTTPLNDLRVRQALAYAMDRKTMNQVAWDGKGLATINPFDVLPNFSIHKDFSVPYDPERAASLIKQAGATGATVPINVLIGSDQGKLEAQIIQQGFQKAGLKAPINLQESTVWLQGLYVTRKSGGITDNYGTLPYPVVDIAGYMLDPTVNPLPPKPSPVPAVYKALQAAQSAIDDKTYRQRLLDLEHLYLKQVAVYLSFIAPNYQVAPSNLFGVEASEFDDQRFASAYLA